MHNLTAPTSSPPRARSRQLGLICAYLALVVLVGTILATAVAESFWLDELHTAWSISGSWEEIAERAGAGNQSPLYFWLLAALVRTVGEFSPAYHDSPGSHRFAWREVLLRLPSLAAWLASVSWLGWYLERQCRRHHLHPLLVPGMLLWLVLDRIQWFFATEGRPYALVQCVSLAGWGCVAAIFIFPSKTPTGFGSRVGWMAAWTVLAITSLYLHLTAGLSVLSQWIAGAVLLLRFRLNLPATTSPLATRRITTLVGSVWILASCLVALASGPLFQLAAPVWRKRELWASFAGNVTPLAVVTLFPLLPLLLPVLGVRLVERLCRSRGYKPAKKGTIKESEQAWQWMWWAALLGPWLLAWGLTASGLAPLFHRRFVIVSALPLVLITAHQLMQIHSTHVRALTLGITIGTLLITQGTAEQWRQGQLIGWLRGEDWRAAARWISDQIAVDERVFCASGLIEANSLEPPLEPAVAEYLAFPLTGAYDIKREGTSVPVRALVNQPKYWGAQLCDAGESSLREPVMHWFVYRGSRPRLEAKMRVLEDSLLKQGVQFSVTSQRSFGAVQVMKLKLGSIP